MHFGRLLWHPLIRIVAFWLVAGGSLWGATYFIPQLSLATVPEVIGVVSEAGLDGAATLVERPEIVNSLALTIVCVGASLLVAFFVMHPVAIRWSTWRAQAVEAAWRRARLCAGL